MDMLVNSRNNSLSFNGKGGSGTRQFRKNVLNPESYLEVRRVKSIGLEWRKRFITTWEFIRSTSYNRGHNDGNLFIPISFTLGLMNDQIGLLVAQYQFDDRF